MPNMSDAGHANTLSSIDRYQVDGKKPFRDPFTASLGYGGFPMSGKYNPFGMETQANLMISRNAQTDLMIPRTLMPNYVLKQAATKTIAEKRYHLPHAPGYAGMSLAV